MKTLRFPLSGTFRGALGAILCAGSFCACQPFAPAEPSVTLSKLPGPDDPGPALTQVVAGSQGPRLSLVDEGGLMIWSSPMETGSKWFSRPFDQQGRPTAPTLLASQSSSRLDSLELRLCAGGVLGFGITAEDDLFAIHVVAFETDGRARTAEHAVLQSQSEIVWADVVGFDNSSLLIWATRSDRGARISALRLSAFGGGEGEPVPLHQGAKGWQVRRSGDLAVLGVVSQEGGVEFISLDQDAQPLVENTVAASESAGADLDLVELGDQLLAVYSDTYLGGRQVFTVRLGPDGVPVTAPRLAVPPRGDQVPVRLVSDGGRTRWLAWRAPEQLPDTLLLAKLDEGGAVVEPVARLTVPDEEVPHLAARAGELSVLVSGCLEAPCPPASGPALTRFDAAMRPARLQLDVGQRRAELGWGLQCGPESCLGLAATLTPAPEVSVFAVDDLTPSGDPTPTPVSEQATLSDVSAIWATDPLADLAAVGSAAGTTVAWLTDFDPSTPYRVPSKPAPDGRMAPVRAQLHVQFIGSDQQHGDAELSERGSEVVSYRARSVSGLSLADGPSGQLLAWSALDGGSPQVFATSLNARGKKLRQALLTHGRSQEVLDVAAAAAGQDWLVAWIDKRKGAPRAYLSLLSPRLVPKRMGVAIGPPTEDVREVAVRMVGETVWVLLNTDDPNGGRVLLQRLKGSTLTALGPAIELAATRQQIRSVAFSTGFGSYASWTEGNTAVVVALEADGTPAARRVWLEAPGTTHTRVDCAAGGCRAVAAVRRSPGTEWFGVKWQQQNWSEPSLLFRSSDSAAAALAPAPVADATWFYDWPPTVTPRIQRAR